MVNLQSGRDSLSTRHPLLQGDILHPSTPLAGVTTLMQRLKPRLQTHMKYVCLGSSFFSLFLSVCSQWLFFDQCDCRRFRILPPLEDRVFRALFRLASVVLDPFPVGNILSVLYAIEEGCFVVILYVDRIDFFIVDC